MVNAILGLTIAFLPLFNRITYVNFERTAKNNLLFLIILAVIPLMGVNRRKLPVSLSIAFTYIAIMTAFNHSELTSSFTIIHSFYLIGGMAFFVKLYKTFKIGSESLILKGMVLGSLIQTILVFLSVFEVYPYTDFLVWVSGANKVKGHGGIGIGSLLNSNLLASYLAITSFAFLKFKKISWMIILPFIALCLSRSAMGIGSFLAGFIYYFHPQKKLFYLGSLTAMVGLYFTGMYGLDSDRFRMWGEVFKKVTPIHALIGGGPGWIQNQKIVQENSSTHIFYFMEEHNEFISFFNLFGLIGIALIAPTFWKFISEKDSNKVFGAVLFASWCNAYGHFNLHQSTTLVIILIASVICLASSRKNYGIIVDR